MVIWRLADVCFLGKLNVFFLLTGGKLVLLSSERQGYTDTLVPEFYDRTYILSGWGEGIFKFAAQMQQLADEVA